MRCSPKTTPEDAGDGPSAPRWTSVARRHWVRAFGMKERYLILLLISGASWFLIAVTVGYATNNLRGCGSRFSSPLS